MSCHFGGFLVKSDLLLGELHQGRRETDSMRTSKPTLRKFGSRRILSSLILLVCMLSYTSASHANGTPKPPPPPPPPSTPTHTPEPTDTPKPTETPEPTETAAPTDTRSPTNTPKPSETPTASDTPVPTATSRPTNTTIPVPPPAGGGQTEGPVSSSDCQSSVNGTVSDRSGQGATGATVVIEGEGWSDSMLTDDSGRFGFAGLCAGAATLSARLADGQASQAARVLLNGRDSVPVNLSAAPVQATVATEVAPAQPTATPEPDLPATGYSGWLLAGAAALGLVLLLSAGMRRVLGDRTQDHN